MSQNDDDEFSVNEKNITMLLLYIIKAAELENGELLSASNDTINNLLRESIDTGSSVPMLSLDYNMNNGTRCAVSIEFREPMADESGDYAEINGSEE